MFNSIMKMFINERREKEGGREGKGGREEGRERETSLSHSAITGKRSG